MTQSSPPRPAAATGAPATLDRSLTLTMLVLYGLGVTIGAGIYVLIGAAAARAGPHAPIAFILAGLIMALTAASFSELAARLPVSAGEAAYVEAAFNSKRAGLVTGLLVVAAGLVSAAAISQGATGYIRVFVDLPAPLVTLAVILGMGAIAAWGIKEAVWFAGAMTLIEIGGLAIIIAAGAWRDPGLVLRAPEAWHGLLAAGAWPGIFGAAMLAFFAFIGFESIVNVAEEAEHPERNMPLAIGITLGLSTLLYILVVWVALHAVPRAELAASDAPLSLVFNRLTGASPALISVIAIFATINGVVVQIVLASRVVYGLAQQGSLPRVLGEVSPVTRTPLAATALVVVLTAASALALPIEELADWTTRVMLVIFALVNAALLVMKRRGESGRGFTVPAWVPAAGLVSCIGLLIADILR